MYFLVINRKIPHFHHKMKIKFIFLAELVILILGKNMQVFYIKIIIIIIIIIVTKISALLLSVNTVATPTTLCDYDGCTGLLEPEREVKINS